MFPANNVWNADISGLPVDPNSSNYINNDMSPGTGLHPDFGSFAGYGIPYNVVSSAQTKVSVDFATYGYADQSDTGPYPVPAVPNIEGNDQNACNALNGGDCHVLIVDKDSCILYELWESSFTSGQWHAGSGAIWSLKSNALRTDGWTSGDAAGLPILPGLVRYDEVQAGLINHALRFTMQHTTGAHRYPARHDASNSSNPLPMGLRVRLKMSANLSGLSPQALVIAHAMQHYGLILADNGSNWYISGASDPNFNDNDLHTLGTLHGSDFEVVDTSSLVNGSDSNTATVNIGQGGLKFVDATSGNGTTTIPINTTVQWKWVDPSHSHSTTSGTCSGSCTPDGKWDSQVNSNGNVFIRTFNVLGTYPYFCSVHGAAMQGTVIVTPPSDYTLAVSSSQTAFVGQNATFSGTLTTTNGYSNGVNLSCGTGHPATCTPAPTPLTPTAGGAGFTVTAGDVTPKDYAFNIQGVGTDTLQLSHAQSVTLHVVDFNETAPAPATLTTAVSASPTTTPTASFQVSASGSFSGTVNLSCGGLPAGATCNFSPLSPLSFSGAGSQPVTVSITVAGSTASGTYPITISANTAGAPAAKTQNVTLQVVDFAQGLPSPSGLSMNQSSVSQPVTFQLAPVNNSGFNASVALSCSGVTGASCIFSPSSPAMVSGAGITETLQVTTNNAAVGTPTLTIQSSATVNGVTLNRSQSLPLTIAAGGTTTDLSISTLTAQPDPAEARGPISITVTAHNNGSNASNVNTTLLFSQPVKIVNATLPAGCSVNSGVVTCASAILNTGNDAPNTIQIIPGFKRNLVITATVGSSSVNDSNVANNTLNLPIHVRPKPMARRGLVPKIP